MVQMPDSRLDLDRSALREALETAGRALFEKEYADAYAWLIGCWKSLQHFNLSPREIIRVRRLAAAALRALGDPASLDGAVKLLDPALRATRSVPSEHASLALDMGRTLAAAGRGTHRGAGDDAAVAEVLLQSATNAQAPLVAARALQEWARMVAITGEAFVPEAGAEKWVERSATNAWVAARKAVGESHALVDGAIVFGHQFQVPELSYELRAMRERIAALGRENKANAETIAALSSACDAIEQRELARAESTMRGALREERSRGGKKWQLQTRLRPLHHLLAATLSACGRFEEADFAVEQTISPEERLLQTLARMNGG